MSSALRLDHLRTRSALLLLVPMVLLAAACTFSTVVEPTSEPTDVDGFQPYTIYVECGLGPAIFDLDGSLWVPVGVTNDDLTKVPSGFASPDDVGTLRLVAPDRAEYLSSQRRLVILERHEGNLEVEGCH